LEIVPQKQKKSKASKETSLKGTFASVMVLGAFLVVTWVTVFILFLARQ
jgi:hypothetical protein